jgi:hypothetical protein
MLNGAASEAELELTAARLRFVILTSRWALDGRQAATLLGIKGKLDLLGFGESLNPLSRDAERRMRILLELDSLLRRYPPARVAPAMWLRCPNDDLVDELTPLEVLAFGSDAARQMLDHLRKWLEE